MQKHTATKYLVDPKSVNVKRIENLTAIQKNASDGIPTLIKDLIEKYSTT